MDIITLFSSEGIAVSPERVPKSKESNMALTVYGGMGTLEEGVRVVAGAVLAMASGELRVCGRAVPSERSRAGLLRRTRRLFLHSRQWRSRANGVHPVVFRAFGSISNRPARELGQGKIICRDDSRRTDRYRLLWGGLESVSKPAHGGRHVRDTHFSRHLPLGDDLKLVWSKCRGGVSFANTFGEA